MQQDWVHRHPHRFEANIQERVLFSRPQKGVAAQVRFVVGVQVCLCHLCLSAACLVCLRVGCPLSLSLFGASPSSLQFAATFTFNAEAALRGGAVTVPVLVRGHSCTSTSLLYPVPLCVH